MTTISLVEYKVYGDNNLYIDSFEHTFKSKDVMYVDLSRRRRILREILDEGKCCTYIKDLLVEYVRD